MTRNRHKINWRTRKTRLICLLFLYYNLLTYEIGFSVIWCALLLCGFSNNSLHQQYPKRWLFGRFPSKTLILRRLNKQVHQQISKTWCTLFPHQCQYWYNSQAIPKLLQCHMLKNLGVVHCSSCFHWFFDICWFSPLQQMHRKKHHCKRWK